MLNRFFNPERIALVDLFGAIGSAPRLSEQVRLLRALEDNSHVRAVILDIDSPGGTVAASEYLYRAVSRVAKQKPVIAFVRGTGASGAYMVSCAATRIVAIPSALVGSIGVIAVRPLLYDMLGRIGIQVDVTKSGRLKDMFSMFREPTPEEREKEQALLDEFYERFVSIVASARSLSSETAHTLATGEVFSAVRAQEVGLVDEVGDMETAIERAMELGNVSRRLMHVHPRRSLRERLLGGMATALVEEMAAAMDRSFHTRIEYRRR